MEHQKKNVLDQIQILWQHQAHAGELDYGFLRTHALTIVEFCDQLITFGGNKPYRHEERDSIRGY